MRGEQLSDVRPPHRRRGSPPLARGTAHIVVVPPIVGRITPACAGNRSRLYCKSRPGITPACAGNSARRKVKLLLSGDHPRLRGEQVALVLQVAPQQGSPPLARGTDFATRTERSGTRITPACAGNSTAHLRFPKLRRDHPRLRGEQEMHPLYGKHCVGSPPLARGTVCGRLLHQDRAGITPACAGNSSRHCRSRRNGGDHPRLRGEQLYAPL